MNWIIASTLNASLIALIFSGVFYNVYSNDRSQEHARYWSLSFALLGAVLILVGWRSSAWSISGELETYFVVVAAVVAFAFQYVAVRSWRDQPVLLAQSVGLPVLLILAATLPSFTGIDTLKLSVILVRLIIGVQALLAVQVIYSTPLPRNIGHHLIGLLMGIVSFSMLGSLALLLSQPDFEPGAGVFLTEQFRSSAITFLTVALWPLGFASAGMLYMLSVTLERLELAQDASLRDPLTNVYNRRGFEIQCRHLLQQKMMPVYPMSVIVIDLDHFKAVNDRFGHSVGDLVIVNFADVLRACTRAQDVVSRFGGEEFVILLTSASQQRAAAIAERMRISMEEHAIIAKGQRIRVTASFGIATGESGYEPEALLREADAAMYRAKAEGRNRIVCAPSAEANT